MPELPEVETTRLGITPHILGKTISEIIIRRHDLRQPIPTTITDLEGAKITSIDRRSKYILIHTNAKTAILIHLGMSGSLRIIPLSEDWKKHDHAAFAFSNKLQLRYHDPRRFGLILTIPTKNLTTHPLLANLGPEPLSENFTAHHLHTALRNKTIPIKTSIMDAKIVVGVGNIYASESLFHAKIHPLTPANKLTKPKAAKLITAIQKVLTESITQGGTTLRDFLNSDGHPGYFQQRLFTYGRKGEPCRICSTPISHKTIAQRSTYWCPSCQKR
jgi:formamidopyrimidine-DNA glycosylase